MPRNPRETPIELAGQRVHFVGIGGCGMSGLARIAQQAGAVCTGSDQTPSDTTRYLEKKGIPVSLEQTAQSVPTDCDLLVISAAISDDHPEWREANSRGIPVVKYAQLLGQLMVGRCGIAVAGTHGKSTTTSLLSHVLIQTQLDPSFIVGAVCKQIGGGSRAGQGEILVAEACEYDRSFHSLYPTEAVILNIEEDHLDVYDSLDAIVEAFAIFARKLPAHGRLLIQHEIPQRLTITGGLTAQVQTIGFAPQADWQVQMLPGSCHLSARVQLLHHGQPVANWQSPLPGEHMAYNAAAAAIMAHWRGADWPNIQQAIEQFQGLDRRMQQLGQRAVPGGCVTIVDDYGHHPTEVDTTLRALRRHYQPGRLICVFQPHQHSRTRFLLEQFAASFSQADIVIIPRIYFVRDSEKERQAVSAADLVDRLRSRGKRAMHLYPFDAIIEQLEVTAQPGDLVVTMGAGDVHRVGYGFLASAQR